MALADGDKRETKPQKRRATKPAKAERTRRAAAPRQEFPKRIRAIRRLLIWGVCAMGLTLLVAGMLLFLSFARRPIETSRPGPIEIDWPEDLDSEQAVDFLDTNGFVENRTAMIAFLRATGGTSGFIAGPHLLSRGATPWELRHSLARDNQRERARLTVPEGFNRFQIGERLEKLKIAGKAAFVHHTADQLLLGDLGIESLGSVGAESAEGYLFPATYEFAVDSHPREVVERLVRESHRRWETLFSAHQAEFSSLQASLGFSKRDVIILASMVEKEAGVDEERPLIASVFLNRLMSEEFRPRHALQSDPTAVYGCLSSPDAAPSCKHFTGKATPAINQDASNRYSTYRHPGLPPGPIASPGTRSIEAVLAPSATKYLYFVAVGGGRHAFSESSSSTHR